MIRSACPGATESINRVGVNAIYWHIRCGGAISTLFLQRHPGVCDAIALTAPMFGIRFVCRHLWHGRSSHWAEAHPRFRDGYAIGTGRWRVAVCYQRTNPRRVSDIDVTYASMLMTQRIRVGGPTYHWAARKVFSWRTGVKAVSDDATPTLLQAEEERVVDNRMHDSAFVNPAPPRAILVEGGRPLVIKGAYHEILLKQDAMRSVAPTPSLPFSTVANLHQRKPLYRGLNFFMYQVVASGFRWCTLLSPDHTRYPLAKETSCSSRAASTLCLRPVVTTLMWGKFAIIWRLSLT